MRTKRSNSRVVTTQLQPKRSPFSVPDRSQRRTSSECLCVKDGSMQRQMARRDTSSRGDLSELQIATALMRAGRQVLRPLSSSLRYDLVIGEGNGAFIRVQCKTGVLRNSG